MAIATLLAARAEGALAGLDEFPLAARLANAALAYATYLRRVVWPMDLAVFYPLDPAPPIGPAVAAGALLAGITAVAVVGRRRWPYVFVGWLWFVGTLVPVVGLVQAGLQAMADRFTYLPLAGLFVGAVWLVEDVCRRASVRPSAIAVSASVIVAAFAVAAWRQVGYWKDGEILFRRALAVTRDNWAAHDSLGYALLKKGDLGAASDHFEQAVRIRPGYALAHYNLGVARMLQGRLDEAKAQFAAAIRWKPNYAEAEFNLGIALTRQGNHLEAIDHFTQAVRDDPRSAAARAGLGSAFLSVGRTDEAVAQLSEAVQLKPDFAAAHFNLAGALALLKRDGEASAHYERAFALDPALRGRAGTR
jgi:tetratricopeptide (TPR) repeat protein